LEGAAFRMESWRVECLGWKVGGWKVGGCRVYDSLLLLQNLESGAEYMMIWDEDIVSPRLCCLGFPALGDDCELMTFAFSRFCVWVENLDSGI